MTEHSDDLVERVARATWWSDVIDVNEHRPPGDALDLSSADPDEWWQLNIEMPLSGEGFKRRWLNIARAAIAAAQSNGAWQPIETAPKDTELLVFMPEEDGVTGAVQAAIHAKIANGHSWFIGHRFGFDCKPPTHWRPLPDPPAAPVDDGE